MIVPVDSLNECLIVTDHINLPKHKAWQFDLFVTKNQRQQKSY